VLYFLNFDIANVDIQCKIEPKIKNLKCYLLTIIIIIIIIIIIPIIIIVIITIAEL